MPNLSFSKSKTYSIIASTIISILILAGCNLPSPTLVPPNPPIPPTETPQTPPTPTVQVETATPSLTATPTATSTPSAVNIVFTTGTTAAVETGTVQAGQVVTYTINAGKNQPMILILDSAHGDVTLGVYEADHSVLLNPALKWNNWQWILPKTEQYTIQVIGGASTENYTLTVKVAEIVSFGSGSTTMTLNGTTINGYIRSYSLNCTAGQTMTVSLNVPASTAYLDVFGIATGVLLSATSKVNNWTGSLPGTQAYIIEVIPNNGQVVNYSLTVNVH